MNYTCNKCKKKFDSKEDHMEMNYRGLQIFLCKECIRRERLSEKTIDKKNLSIEAIV